MPRGRGSGRRITENSQPTSPSCRSSQRRFEQAMANEDNASESDSVASGRLLIDEEATSGALSNADISIDLPFDAEMEPDDGGNDTQRTASTESTPNLYQNYSSTPQEGAITGGYVSESSSAKGKKPSKSGKAAVSAQLAKSKRKKAAKSSKVAESSSDEPSESGNAAVSAQLAKAKRKKAAKSKHKKVTKYAKSSNVSKSSSDELSEESKRHEAKSKRHKHGKEANIKLAKSKRQKSGGAEKMMSDGATGVERRRRVIQWDDAACNTVTFKRSANGIVFYSIPDAIASKGPETAFLVRNGMLEAMEQDSAYCTQSILGFSHLVPNRISSISMEDLDHMEASSCIFATDVDPILINRPTEQYILHLKDLDKRAGCTTEDE